MAKKSTTYENEPVDASEPDPATETLKKSYSMKELRDLQGREAPEESERSEPIPRPKLESEKDQDKPADEEKWP
jgi:hypothetical protein